MIRDQETIKQLVDLIERFVGDLYLMKSVSLPKAGYLTTFSKR